MTHYEIDFGPGQADLFCDEHADPVALFKRLAKRTWGLRKIVGERVTVTPGERHYPALLGSFSGVLCWGGYWVEAMYYGEERKFR
jgi:hypothetical protein